MVYSVSHIPQSSLNLILKEFGVAYPHNYASFTFGEFIMRTQISRRGYASRTYPLGQFHPLLIFYPIHPNSNGSNTPKCVFTCSFDLGHSYSSHRRSLSVRFHNRYCNKECRVVPFKEKHNSESALIND